MKKKSKILETTKNGGASVFVVILTVIILSIVTMGFTRLIISEATKTTNTDLSQSAYDSALAGIEDAKVALLKYHSCLDEGYTANDRGYNKCGDLIYTMQNGMEKEDCSIVTDALKRNQSDEDNSTIIQETTVSGSDNTNMLQAYTCVTIKEDLEDYRTTLSSDSRLRIIPIRSDKINDIKRVRIQWYSDVNASDCSEKTTASVFKPASDTRCAYPVLSVRLIQTDKSFNLSELSVSSSETNTDTGTLVLQPNRINSVRTSISASEWGKSANKGMNEAIGVSCNIHSDWLCSADIDLPATFSGSSRNEANTYLLVSLPYGNPETDVSVSAYTTYYDPFSSNNDESRVDFSGVQARVDSTGRANDLFRRVETRVELVDTYFAYPEFEITMTSGGGNAIEKNFYVTYDCWNTDADLTFLEDGYGNKDGYDYEADFNLWNLEFDNTGAINYCNNNQETTKK